jgi:hypothetical protein
MNLTKVSRNDWIVVGGFILAFVGTLGAWYTVHVDILGQKASASVNGWHGAYLGWLVFLLCLAAAVLALSKALNVSLPLPAPVLILGCGAVSALLVLIRLVIVPGAGFAAGVAGVHVGRGWGIWITLIATIVVAVGGLLKNAEPAG